MFFIFKKMKKNLTGLIVNIILSKLDLDDAILLCAKKAEIENDKVLSATLTNIFERRDYERNHHSN